MLIKLICKQKLTIIPQRGFQQRIAAILVDQHSIAPIGIFAPITRNKLPYYKKPLI